MIAAVAATVVLSAAPVPRADLVVPRGTVRAANGTLSGAFVVANSGRKAGSPSTATLSVKVGRRRRVIGRFAVSRLRPGSSRLLRIAVKLPANLPAGTLPVRACADSGHTIRERSETNNCRRIGQVVITAGGGGSQTGGSQTGGTQTGGTQTGGTQTGGTQTGGDQTGGTQTGGDQTGGTQTGGQEPSSVPTDPVAYQKNTVFTLDDPQGTYWVDIPDAYDDSNQTPIRLLVWLHGCGGESSGDIYNVSPGGDQSWIAITVGGREDDCWDVNADGTKVLAAIADVEKHFNIDRHHVVIGGYSSGGDLAYRTAFYNANLFAGLLAENTSPFRDTGSSQADSLAAASWKFNVVHLAHSEDDVYPVAGVENETNAMKNAGFPLTLVEQPGTHYDADTATTGTDHDVRTILLPHMNDDWRSP